MLLTGTPPALIISCILPPQRAAALVVTPYHIKAGDVKLCVNCKYFERSKCKRFVDIDVVTGDSLYLDAQVSRNEEALCGLSGKLYESLFDQDDSLHDLGV